MRDLVLFVQFKKHEKHPRSVTFSKVKLKPATLLKVTLLHGCFWRFLNFANGTKSRKAPLFEVRIFPPLYTQCPVVNECNRSLRRQTPFSYETANHFRYTSALRVSPQRYWISFESAVHWRVHVFYIWKLLWHTYIMILVVFNKNESFWSLHSTCL